MARFSKKSLEKGKKRNNDYNLNKIINGKSITKIYNELEISLKNTEDHILYGKPIEKINSETFLNKFPNQGQDANVYGLSFNVVGVLVGPFLQNRDCDNKEIGNKDILLFNVKITHIKSHPVEVICISEKNGTGIQKGSVGNALDIKSIINHYDGSYNGNIVSDTNIAIASTIDNNNPNLQKIGTNNIDNEIVNCTNSNEPISTVMDKNNFKYVYGKDSMIHEMKGSIGLFFSGACGVKVVNTMLNDVKVLGNYVSSVNGNAKGGNCHGILLTASKDIEFLNTNVCNIETENVNSVCEKLTSINNSEWSGNIGEDNVEEDSEIETEKCEKSMEELLNYMNYIIKKLIIKLILKKLKD